MPTDPDPVRARMKQIKTRWLIECREWHGAEMEMADDLAYLLRALAAALEAATLAPRELADMQRASALVDKAREPNDYQVRMVALALIARQYLRAARPAPQEGAEP